MLDFWKKKNPGQTITFKIEGMHCTSCAVNIDGELEDTDGVLSADTSYAQSQIKISYDPTKIAPEKLKKIIESLDYTVKLPGSEN